MLEKGANAHAKGCEMNAQEKNIIDELLGDLNEPSEMAKTHAVAAKTHKIVWAIDDDFPKGFIVAAQYWREDRIEGNKLSVYQGKLPWELKNYSNANRKFYEGDTLLANDNTKVLVAEFPLPEDFVSSRIAAERAVRCCQQL